MGSTQYCRGPLCIAVSLSLIITGSAVGAPPGSLRLDSAKIVKSGAFLCGNVSGTKWIPGSRLSGGFFYPLSAEIKNNLRALRVTSSAKEKKSLEKKVARLSKRRAAGVSACTLPPQQQTPIPTPSNIPTVLPTTPPILETPPPTSTPVTPTPNTPPSPRPTPNEAARVACTAARLDTGFETLSSPEDLLSMTETGRYVMTRDITFSRSETSSIIPRFSGHLDGCGYSLSGLNLEAIDSGRVGLFGTLLTGAVVENVLLEGFRVKGLVSVGNLAGSAIGATIRNVVIYNSHSEAIKTVGGVVGYTRNSNFSNVEVWGARIGVYGDTSFHSQVITTCRAMKQPCLDSRDSPTPLCAACLDSDWLLLSEPLERNELGGAVGLVVGGQTRFDQISVCDTSVEEAIQDSGGLAGSLGRAYNSASEIIPGGSSLRDISVGARVEGVTRLSFGANGSWGMGWSDSIGGVVGSVRFQSAPYGWSALNPVTFERISANSVIVSSLTTTGVRRSPVPSGEMTKGQGGLIGLLMGFGKLAIQDAMVRVRAVIPDPYLNVDLSGVVGRVEWTPSFHMQRVLALPAALPTCPQGLSADQCGTRNVRGISYLSPYNPSVTSGWQRKAAFDGELAGNYNTTLYYAYSTSAITDGSSLRSPTSSIGLSEAFGWTLTSGQYPSLTGTRNCLPPQNP
jgi:hypothetical protein